MKHLFKILILLATVASARGAMMASPLTTNAWVTRSNLTASLKLTNATFWGYGTVFSNSVPSDNAVSPNKPAFQPFGGTYYGVTVSNSASIGNTNAQAALGFGFQQTGITFSNVTFYDGVFVSTGSNSDSVNWNTDINTVTNNAWFYNCKFIGQHYGFQNVSRGYFNFNNCLFQAIGPSGDGSAIAVLPDQGPETNVFNNCQFVARNGGAATWGILIQVKTYNIFNCCTIDVTSTNAAEPALMGFTYSGEGDYYTVFNSCFFHLAGGSTNYVADLSPGGVRAITVLNNCYWDGAYGPVVILTDNQDATSSLTVNGGNFTPANFSVPSAVTWQSPYGSAVNVSAFLVKTNFVQGFIYTNFYGVPIEVNANIRVTTAAVTGDADMDLQQPAGTLAARVGLQSVAAQTNECHLIWKIPVSGTYAITNTLTTGAGNAVIVIGGQIFVY